MKLTFVSYNVHKAVGLDRRRDPERIMAILHEIEHAHGADVIALQEVDRRFGPREAAIPHRLIEEHGPWVAVAPRTRPQSLGWHGNVILVRKGIGVHHCGAIPLPTLEPRGAVTALLDLGGRPTRVVGTHLDLSGLRRRHQVGAVCEHLAGHAGPAVVMGDFNEWSPLRGALAAFPDSLRVHAPGPSFPAQRPVGQLDRIVASREWQVEALGVHMSPLARIGSDHLPVWARLELTGD